METDKLLENNQRYSKGEGPHKPNYPGKQPIQPSKRVAVVACMDARLDVEDPYDVDTGKLEEVKHPGPMGSFG